MASPFAKVHTPKENSRPSWMILLAKHLHAKLITNVNSGHHIHVERPQLVIAATREIVDAARKARRAPVPTEP
jgi:hypothetical protein